MNDYSEIFTHHGQNDNTQVINGLYKHDVFDEIQNKLSQDNFKHLIKQDQN